MSKNLGDILRDHWNRKDHDASAADALTHPPTLALREDLVRVKKLNAAKLAIAVKALEVIEEDSATVSANMLGMIARAALLAIEEAE